MKLAISAAVLGAALFFGGEARAEGCVRGDKSGLCGVFPFAPKTVFAPAPKAPACGEFDADCAVLLVPRGDQATTLGKRRTARRP